MTTAEDLERLTAAIRAYHAAAMEAERGGLNAHLVARVASAEQELAREQAENAELRRQLAAYELADAEQARRRRRLRVVGHEEA